MKIEISAKAPEKRSFNRKDNGEQINLICQQAAMWFDGEDWPLKFELSYREGSRQPYVPGFYTFGPKTFQVDRGRLQLAFDLELVPLALERTNLQPLKTGS